MASVVIMSPATDDAACSAVRVTLAGSRIPIFQHVAVLARGRVVAIVAFQAFNLVEHNGAFVTGVGRDLTQWSRHGA